MSHPDDPHDDLTGMRYFTPDLIQRLNSSDDDAVSAAMARWEKAVMAYRKTLCKIQHQMPAQLRAIANESFHDWTLVAARLKPDAVRPNGANDSALILLKQDRHVTVLRYSLTREPQVIAAPRQWPLSKRRVHWLYDELDNGGEGQDSLVHRVLLSDGRTLLIPFSACEVWRLRATKYTRLSFSECASASSGPRSRA